MALPKVTEYAKNVVKSITYSAVDVAKSEMPTLAAYVDQDSNRELARSLYAGVKDYKNSVNKAKSAIKSSKLYEAADLGVKSALDDLKTGKFYNRERIDAIEAKAAEAMFGSFEDMDLDMTFSDENSVDISTGDKLIAASAHVSAIRAADMITQTQIKSTDAIIKSQKASTQALYTQGAQIIGSLKEVAFVGSQTQGAIVNLTEIQKTSAQNSKIFYETSTKLFQENNAMLKEMLGMQRALYKAQDNKKSNDRMTHDDIVSYDGAVDLKNYIKNVKQNAKSVMSDKSGGVFDLLSGMDGSMLNMFAASPLQFISTAMLKSFMPNNVRSASGNFDKTLSGIPSTVLARFNNMATKSDNPFVQAIGEIFGVKTKPKASLDSSKFNKGAVPFDGVVRKTIVDAIPTYLRRIEAAITGKPEKIYDATKGNWTDARRVREEYKEMLRTSKSQANYDLVAEFNKVLNSKKSPKFGDKFSRDDFTKSLETFLDRLYDDDGDFKFRSKDDAYKYDISQDAFEQIAAIMTNKENKSMQRARIRHSGQVMSAKGSLNSRMQYLEEMADSPLFQLFNGSTESINFKTPKYEDAPTTFRGAIDLNSQKDKFGNNIFYYLQNMYAELYTIRSSTGMSPIGAASISRNISSSFKIANNKIPSAKDRYYASETEASRRYDDAINKHTKAGGKLYDIVDTDGNIRMDRATVEQREIIEKLRADNASHGWLNDTLYGNTTSLDRLNSAKSRAGKQAIDGKSFFDRMKVTKNLSEKLAVLQDQVNKITKTPGEQVTKLLEKADARIYDFFYGAETGEEDEDGNKITGFMQLMSIRLNVAIDKFTTMIDTKIFDPIKKKLGVENMKDLMDKMGVTKIWDSINDKMFGEKDADGKRKGGIFGDTREEIKRVFGGAKDYVIDSMKDVFKPVTSRVKSALSNKPKTTGRSLSKNEITPEITNLMMAAAANPNNDALQEIASTALAIIEQPKSTALAVIRDPFASIKNRGTSVSTAKSTAIQGQPLSGTSLMARVNETLSKILITFQSVVRENAVVVKVKPKYQTRTSSTPRLLSHSRMGRESETEGDSTGDSDGELHSSAFGNSFKRNTTSALSKGELYGRNGLFSKVPSTGVYDVKAGTTVYPTNKNKSIELAGEQSSIGKFLSKLNITTNAGADSRPTKIIDGKVFSLGDDKKWHNYQPDGKGGVTDNILEAGFLDQMYSTARGGLNSVLTGLGFNGLANTNAVTTIDGAMETVKKYAPKMTANGLLGGAIGLLSGNPLLGATIGAVSGYVQSSDQAKDMLFGKKTVDDQGNEYRAGGMVSKQTQDTMKKYLPNMGKYGTTGAVLGLLTPFGLVGGATIGSAIGWATTNDRIKEALFGTMDNAKSGLISKEVRDRVKKAAPSMAIGGIAGILAGPFGILGNLALGSGIGFLSTSQEFKNAIFGEEKVDENGNKVRQGGLVGAIKVNVVDPLKDFANTFKTKAEDFIINDMINPLKDGLKPIMHEMALLAKGMVGFVPKMLSQMFETTFGRPLQDIIRDRIISPVATIAGKTANIAGGIGSRIVSAPFKMVGAVGRGLQSKHIRKGDASYISAAERLAFRNENSGRGILSNIPLVGNSIFGSLGMNPTGYRDKYKDIDETLASIQDPKQLKAAMTAMETLSKGKNYYKKENIKTGRGIMTQLSAVFPSGITNRIKKAMERNDINTVSNLIRSSKTIKGTELSAQEREVLIEKSIESLKTIEENNRKSNITKDERKNLFSQLGSMGFTGIGEKNIGKVHDLLKTEYALKKNMPGAKSEQQKASESSAKLVSDPITDNATKNANDIIEALTSSLKRIEDIQLASLPAGKARRLMDKKHQNQKNLGGDALKDANTADGDSIEEKIGVKWIFDSGANSIRKFVKTSDGWNEAPGKAKANADRAEAIQQERSAASLAGGIGTRIKDLLGIGVNQNTGEKKENPVVNLLKKAAKVIGIGALGATAIAGTGHASQFVVDNVFPKIESIWENKIQPFLKDHLGGLYDKLSGIATHVGDFVVNAPRRIHDTVSTLGQWFSGSGEYKGAGFPYVFQSKILPWYLDGFEKFATIYLPPITKAIVVALPTIAKGLAKGVWAGIKALVYDKDRATEPDFNTSYNIDFSADRNIYARSSSSLSKIKPVNGGSGWWTQRGTGLDSIFNFSNSKVTVPASGKSREERSANRYSIQKNINSSKKSMKGKYISEGILNAKEIDPNTGEVYYNPAYMPVDSRGNHYLPDGSISTDNSSNLFDPLGGANSYKDRGFKGVSRLLLGGGGSAGAFKLLKGAGSGIQRLGLGGKIIGGTMKLAGTAGEAAVNHIPNVGMKLLNGNTVGNVAMNMGESMMGSGNSYISKMGGKIAGSNFAQLGTDAFTKNSADLLVNKGVLNAGETVLSRTGSKVVATGTKNITAAATEAASGGLISKLSKGITEGIRKLFSSKVVVSFAKDGMQTAGKELTEAAATKIIAEAGESIIKRLIKVAGEKLAKAGAKIIAKITSAVATGFLSTIAFAAWDFVTGTMHARDIFGLTKNQDIGIFERFIAGLLKCVNGFLTLGLIPEGLMVDIFVDVLAPLFKLNVDDINKRRDSSKEEVKEYNSKNGTSYSVEEYNNRNSIGTKLVNGVKDGAMNIGSDIGSMFKSTMSGDMMGVMKTGIDPKQGVGGLIKSAALTPLKTSLMIPATIVGGIKAISKIAGPILTKITSIGSEFGSNAALVGKGILSGDMKAMLLAGNSFTTAEGNLDPSQLITNIATLPIKLIGIAPTMVIGGIKSAIKLIKPIITPIADAAKTTMSTLQNTGSFVKSGDIIGLAKSIGDVRTEDGNVSVGKVMGSAVTAALFPILSVPTLVVAAGKATAKQIGKIIGPIKNNYTIYQANDEKMKALTQQGNVSALLAYTPQEGEENNPFAFMHRATTLISKFVYTPMAGFNLLGNKIKGLSINAKEISVNDIMTKMWEYTNTKKHATMDGFESIGGSLDGSNPLGNITTSVLLAVGKPVVGILRSLSGLSSFIATVKGGKGEEQYAKAGTGKYGLGRVYQNDPKYASIPFNSAKDTVNQTIGNSGCGPAAAVNAVNYAYGTGSLEDAAKMALNGGYKEKNGGTTPGFFKSYFNKNGLQSNRLNNNKDILNSIQSGSPVVLMGTDKTGNNTPYGPNPHYIVGKGVDSKGNIIVDDPESRYGTSKYPASKVLNRTSIAISASRYGRAANPLLTKLTGDYFPSAIKSTNSLAANLPKNYLPATFTNGVLKAKATTSSPALMTDKVKYTIAFACLPYVDKPFSTLYGTNIIGTINSAIVKAGKTISEGDKNKTVRTVLNNYLQLRMGPIQDFANAIAKYSGVTLDELKKNNSALYTQLKDITQQTANLNIQTFGKKGVGEICTMIGLTFKGDAPVSSVKTYPSIADTSNNALDDSNSAYSADMTSSIGDGAVKENIFDKISNFVKGFFNYTNKDTGEKRNLLDVFGIGGGTSTSSSNQSSTGTNAGLSDAQRKVQEAMSSIIGKNTYNQANRYKVGASLEGASQGSADCSSTTQWALRKAGVDPGGDTGSQISSAAGQWIDGPFSFGKNGKPLLSNLALGDLMFYGTSNSGKPQNVSHVEMYWGDGKRIGHGGGIGPKVSEYTAKSSTQQYLGSKRFLPIGSVSGYGSPNVSGGTIEENKKTIWSFLKNKGYNEVAAAGIMGNIGQECGFRHDLVQGNGKGPGVGICQWSSTGRKNAFLRAVPDWKTNLVGQLEFMYSEISSSYRQVLPDGLNKCSTAQEATKMFHDVYEKSNDYKAYGGLTKRFNFADNMYQQFASGNKTVYGTGKHFARATELASKYGRASELGIVRNGQVTSGFDDPTRVNHKGIDIAASNGQAIISPINGQVIRSEYNDTNGNMVVVQSNDGYLYSFYHMNARKSNVGDRVSIGTVLGTVGSTGNSAGDHVHYQVTDPKGQFVDPLNINRKSSIKQNNQAAPVRAIGGSDGVDYTQLIKIIIEVLGTISDNTLNFTKALNLISEKAGVDLSGIDTSSKEAALSQIKNKLKAIDSSYGRGSSDLGSSMMGSSTDYLLKAMRTIAQD